MATDELALRQLTNWIRISEDGTKRVRQYHRDAGFCVALNNDEKSWVIRQYKSGNAELRALAVRAIGVVHIVSDESVAVLKNAIADESLAVRNNACQVLLAGQAKSFRQLLPAVLSQLAIEEKPRVTGLLIRCAMRLGHQDAASVHKYTAAEVPDVALEAHLAMWQMTRDVSWFVRANRVASEPGRSDLLRRVLSEIPVSDHKETRDRRVVERVYSLADHPADVVRTECALAIGRLGGERSEQLLARLTSDADVGVRMASVEALGKLDTASSKMILCALIEKSDELPICYYAVRGLREPKTKRMPIECILVLSRTMLSSDSKEKRLCTATVLAEYFG